MTENRYTITEAANILNIRTHTLRYWEEELELAIPRNEMGHRVYYQEQIEQFEMIRNLKEQGYQLTAIRMQLLDKASDKLPQVNHKEMPLAVRNTVKIEQFQGLMNEIVKQAMLENNDIICKRVEERILKEFHSRMEEQEEREEDRYHKLDEAIRQMVQKQYASKKEKIKKNKVIGQGENRRKEKVESKQLFGRKKEAVKQPLM